MLRAYLDTNIYDNASKGNIPQGDLDNLRSAVAFGRLTIHVSFELFSEFFTDLEKHRPAVVRRIEITRDLATFDHFIKSSEDLLSEALHAYAFGREQPPYKLPERLRVRMLAHLEGTIKGDPALSAKNAYLVRQNDLLAEEFRSRMVERSEVIRDGIAASQERSIVNQSRNLNWIWDTYALNDAEWIADLHGLGKDCRARGIAGLLKVKTIRLYVATVLAYELAVVRGVQGQPRQAKRADHWDLRHVIAASTADAFVTGDSDLRKHLQGKATSDFPVLSSIAELLQMT